MNESFPLCSTSTLHGKPMAYPRHFPPILGFGLQKAGIDLSLCGLLLRLLLDDVDVSGDIGASSMIGQFEVVICTVEGIIGPWL